jgi:hypothetical protein
VASNLELHVQGFMTPPVQFRDEVSQLLSQLRDVSVKLPHTLTGWQALRAAPISRGVGG